MMRRALLAGLVAALGGGAFVGYEFIVWQRQAEEYRWRLETLTRDYQALRETYNEAVRRTAVTELKVESGKLSVVVRTAEGQLREVPTPYDPRAEIYVDYAVLDGRLWIRRVFDQNTPPQEAVVIDPLIGQIDWDTHREEYGKAVYRRLGEGRWVVTVTGDGSLGLKKVTGSELPRLSPPPPVREYGQVE